MSDVYEHPLGDLEPPYEFTVYQQAARGDAGAVQLPDRSFVKPVNLTLAEHVYAVFVPASGGPPVLKREAARIDAANGVCRMPWQLGDFVQTVAGVFLSQAEIRWPGDRPQSVPTRGRGRRFVVTQDAG